MKEKNTLKKLRTFIETLSFGIPYFLVAGILDYRFHNSFYKYLNIFRPFSNKAFFDFFSVYDFYIWSVSSALVIYFITNPKKHFFDIKAYLTDKYILLCISLLLLGGLAAAISYNPTEPIIHSFISYTNTNYLTPLLSALLIAFSFDTKEKLNSFIKHMIFAFSILGGATVFQYTIGTLPGTSHDFLNRAVWPYVDPFSINKPESANWLSYIFAPLFLMSTYQICETKKKNYSDTLLYMAGLFIGLAVVISSKSYAGLGACGIVTFAYLFKKIPTIKQKLVLIILSIVLVTGFLYSQINSQKLQILLGNYKKENSLERRVQIYTVTLNVLGANPITGIGPGNFQSYFRQSMPFYLDKPIPEEEVPPHAHNLLLHFWSELGICGLAFIFLTYCTIIIVWCKKARITLGILLISYVLLHGIVDVPFGLQEASTLFFIWISLVVSFRRHSTETGIDANP